MSASDRTGAYQRFLDTAREAGRQAWRALPPEDMPGNALVFMSARSGFARWLLERGYAFRAEAPYSGIVLSSPMSDDDRALAEEQGDLTLANNLRHQIAYCEAFADVLRQGDITGVRVRTHSD